MKTEKAEDKRTCKKCSETKVVAPETWVYRKNRKGIYQAHGLLCLACEKARHAEYDEKRRNFTALIKADANTDPKKAKEQSKLDAALALKLGARAINEISAGVIARLAQYAEDPDSEHHAMALEFFAHRIAPKRLYEELGGEAAGLGAISDKRPQFIINIHPAKLPEEGRVIDVDVTPLLPAPAEKET